MRRNSGTASPRRRARQPAATALIAAALREALAGPAFARQIETRGFAPDFLPAAGLARATEEERERWTPCCAAPASPPIEGEGSGSGALLLPVEALPTPPAGRP